MGEPSLQLMSSSPAEWGNRRYSSCRLRLPEWENRQREGRIQIRSSSLHPRPTSYHPRKGGRVIGVILREYIM
ncbi:hypothetical protein L2E82_12742 [Cichorium intybus]|uniref:Uncharacterized protein n=1 Tax=Cichorium intybus TaxID=13427 RepID=A0ACB9GI13_CICIN|nr:hypothetical protein L2E82_12742 [Cichorium intybus]